MNAPSPHGTRTKLLEAIGVLLVVAFGTRIASGLLTPLIPSLFVMAMLGGVTWYLFSRRH
jgi:hypothetical protein